MQLTSIMGFISYLFAQAQDAGLLTVLQQKFVAGGAFMWPILGCLIIGLGFSFERLWTLTRDRKSVV